MRDPNDKTAARPADIRSISDPPDMGRLRPAEAVAKELVVVDRHGARVQDALDQAPILYGEHRAPAMRSILERIIRQSRAEGAAAALEAAAVHFVGVRRDPEGSAILRARAKAISDPPDMG